MKISHLLKLLTFTFSVGVTYQTAFASSTETEEVPDVMPGMIRIADIDRTEGGCAVTLRDIHPQEVHNIGVCYQYGMDVEVNLQIAFRLYSLAAEQEFAPSLNNLGYFYEHGITVPKDQRRAFELYSKAAEHGFCMAKFSLGVCFQRGIGVDVDLKQAFDLYTVAAEEGLPLAQCNLGIMYKNGSSVVSKDINKATEWLRKAAIQGDEVAQRALSSIS